MSLPGGTLMTETMHGSAAEAEGVDVLSNAVYADGVPHEALAELRRTQPIFHQTIPDERMYDEAWVLTRYEHVLEASKDTDHFVNAHGLNLRASYTEDEDRHLLNVDDPEHLRLRRITNRGFTPRVVRRYGEHYRDLAGQLLDSAINKADEAPGGGVRFDVVDQLSVPLPLLAICELLGTTPDDQNQLVLWSNAIITNDDPDYSPDEASRVQAFTEMNAYFQELLAARRANPGDDLASVLAQHLDSGQLNQGEFNSYLALLFVAGNETTRNAISHGLLQLAINPDQYELLKTGEYYDTAVEEMIRWASPVIYMSRTVIKERDFHGVTFAPGEKIVLHYASANRDEDIFEDSMRFDVTRDPNPHIAFGFGAHFCLGAHLARLEIRSLLEELVSRASSLSLSEPETYVRSSFISGVKKLVLDIA